jgi:type IV secretory pathway VirJ component
MLLSAVLIALSVGSCRRLGQRAAAERAVTEPTAAERATVGPPTSLATSPDSIRTDTVTFGAFGPVVLYRTREHPSRVVLFISGDGGWNLGVVDMAHSVASMDALVVGVDIRRYLSALRRGAGSCAYPAADFEALSQWVQHRLGFPTYVPPVLVGYSSGATLVYATLAQAPPGTFRAGLSLGFCPRLGLDRPLCRGSGLMTAPAPAGHGMLLLPADGMPAPWIVLQGQQDSTCALSAAAEFVGRIRGAELVSLPTVGHGFGVQAHWLPQFRLALERLTRETVAAGSPAAVRDLPLVELPTPRPSDLMAVVISGDGGWASLDRQIGEAFAAQGVPVVGLNSLQYFWKKRSPDEIGRDLSRIVSHYLVAWRAHEVLLVGYSRGADVLPFMASRLPPELRQHVRLLVLLAPGRATNFEFHVTDWLGRRGKSDLQPIAPEIEKLRGIELLCLYGADEKDTACPELPPGLATVVPLEGGHHFGGAYRGLADRILGAAARIRSTTSLPSRPGMR